MAQWEPWRGCHKCSEGCLYCYIHKGDARRGRDTSSIEKTSSFDAPIRRDHKGNLKMKGGQRVYLCFSSDFLLEEADAWREACWAMIRARPDLDFLFLTKRIERFMACIPDDWGEGYENVTVGCSVENQKNVDRRLGILKDLPIRHKNIICQPLLEAVDLSRYLDGVELVVVGGESDVRGRTLDYAWVLAIREQCIERGVAFSFRQCATHFLKDAKNYTLKTKDLCALARKANINYDPRLGLQDKE